MSSQREWQKRKAAQERCKICGKELNRYKNVCDLHASKNREYQRRTRGCKLWVEGTRKGRPPKNADALIAIQMAVSILDLPEPGWKLGLRTSTA